MRVLEKRQVCGWWVWGLRWQRHCLAIQRFQMKNGKEASMMMPPTSMPMSGLKIG